MVSTFLFNKFHPKLEWNNVLIQLNLLMFRRKTDSLNDFSAIFLAAVEFWFPTFYGNLICFTVLIFFLFISSQKYFGLWISAHYGRSSCRSCQLKIILVSNNCSLLKRSSSFCGIERLHALISAKQHYSEQRHSTSVKQLWIMISLASSHRRFNASTKWYHILSGSNGVEIISCKISNIFGNILLFNIKCWWRMDAYFRCCSQRLGCDECKSNDKMYCVYIKMYSDRM